MTETRAKIEQRILNLDARDEHETDADIAEEYHVSESRVGQIRRGLYDSGEIDPISDFAPQAAKREVGREHLNQNPNASPEDVAKAVNVSVPTAKKIHSQWKMWKEVEWQPWMEGKRLFPYSGSKWRIIGWILWEIPEYGRLENPKRFIRLPEHSTFVEVFAGGATALVNKPPSETEVLNDANSDVAHFFETLRDHGEEIREFLQSAPFDRERYDEWIRRWEQDGWRPKDEVKRAAVFFYGRFTQARGKVGRVGGFNWQRGSRTTPEEYYERRDQLHAFQKRFHRDDPDYFQQRYDLAVQPRLDNPVIVENLDYSDVLTEYDAEDTLFYLDPPYVGKESEYPDGKDPDEEKEFDHEQFVQKLTALDGDFILSYGDETPDGLDNYRTEVMSNPDARRTEHLILSFPEEEEGAFRPPTIGNDAMKSDWE